MYNKNEQIKIMPHFGGGLDNNDIASEINDWELADITNFEVDDKVIMTAAGIVDYGSDDVGGPIYGAFQGQFEDGSDIRLRQNGSVLQYDIGNAIWKDTDLTLLAQTRASFAMLNNTILISNGVDPVYSSTDGMTWTEQATLPRSKKIVHNKLNRIIFAAQPDTPSKINWSEINDPLTVDAAAYQFIGKNDGEHIQDVVVTEQGGVYIFKTKNVYVMGDVTFNMVGVDPIGSFPYVPFTAVVTENSVMATGVDGIYEIGGATINHISKNLNKASTNLMTMNTPVATYFNNKYRVSLPINSMHNDVEYVLNRKQQTGNPFSPYVITKNNREIGCYMLEEAVVSNVARYRVYIGGSVDGSFGWINEYHDQGEPQGVFRGPQTCTFTTKFFTENAEFFIKRYLRFFISVVSLSDTIATIEYRYDIAGNWLEKLLQINTAEFGWEYDDGTTGDFDEGYSFMTLDSVEDFISLEKYNTNEVNRGVQFRFTVETTKDLKILSTAFKFITKPNFH